jgi:hypothetical protein
MATQGVLEDFLASAEKASAVNGATIVDIEGGAIQSGTSAIAVPGTSLNGYRHLAITVKNKANSVSALTFTFQEKNIGVLNFDTVTLATVRMSIGNTGYAYVATALAGLSCTLTVTVNADPVQPAGEDYYRITVTGYTS